VKKSEILELKTALIDTSVEAAATMMAASEIVKKAQDGQYRLCYVSSKLDLDKFNLSAFNRLMILAFIL